MRNLFACLVWVCMACAYPDGDERICWAMNILNDAFRKDSPFEVVLELTGSCAYCQVLRQRAKIV